MKLKKAFVIFGTLITIVIIFIIYSAKDLTGYPNKKTSISQDYHENKWLHFEDRIKQLEESVNLHNDAVHEIKIAMKKIQQPNLTNPQNRIIQETISNKSQVAASEFIYESYCPFQINYAPVTTVQMLNVYKSLKFDNPDGGVWKQGWRIEVDEKDWNRQNKLKVFVVPHSHNDPGWVKTIEEYYITQTKRILSNMLIKLPEDPRRKFIWAEISYFSMWWDELDEEEKKVVKSLLKKNQLEIVTGGWVMNDEANSHWVSIVHQLTEGHQWLQEHLNYTPQSHWSIDPFGMSLTQPALLKEVGLQNMLIQRVHYSIKKQLASEQQLEFRWRQLWDNKGKTDVFTHLLPFYSYDIPHTCGPDPKICCQFDFKRLPNHGLSCPWKIPPQPITEKNVAPKAELLLDQYRKKSKLYKTNVLLIPLGDDFRYDQPAEWDVQFENYQKLFDHMNSKLHLHVKAQFGTLTDYFNELNKEKKQSEFPTLSGDFFTYSDRDDHYWSGYYTSRPFYKRMDRVLLSYVRGAETIHTLASLSGKPGSNWIVDKKYGLDKDMTKARQAFSLFQHHDAITGTAKDHVMVDYGKKMLKAIQICQKVIQQCAHILLDGDGADTPSPELLYYNVDDVRHSHNALSERYQITIGVPELRTKKVVLFNFLTFTRTEVVTFHVSTPFVEVRDFRNNLVKCQVSPVFEYGSSMSQTKYQLSFVVTIPAFALVSYTVNAMYETEMPKETVFAKIFIYNQYNDVQIPNGFEADVSPSYKEFTLQNSRVTASFNNFGLLKALKTSSNTIPVHLDFAKYGVHLRNSERSGAYLFLPDGNAVPLPPDSPIVDVIEGPIMSSVTVQLAYVRHTSTLYNTPGADGLGIEIENIVDIAKTSNFELVMRLSTNINSTDEFFTDVNGYQIMRRKRFEKLPIQANFYPIPTMGYIEDKHTRLTIVTGSPLGCSSLLPGQIEVMLDRRLNQDDNLGVGQGVLDNHPTRHVFRILLENRAHPCKDSTAENHPAGFPSLSAHVASQTLLNPLLRLLRTEDEDTISKTVYSPVEEEFGVDFSMPILKSNVLVKGKKHVGFVVHRQYVDACFDLRQFPLSYGTVNISALIPSSSLKKMHKTSLSFNYVKNEVYTRSSIAMCPMEMQAFILL